MNSRIPAFAAVVVLLVVCQVAGLSYVLYSRFTLPPIGRLTLTPPVGDVGNNAFQNQQIEFDERLEKLNQRIESANQRARSYATAQDWMVWPALIITILLTGFAYFTRREATIPAQAANPLSPNNPNNAENPEGQLAPDNRRKWIAYVITGLAFLSTVFQLVEKQLENESKKKSELAIRLNTETNKARIKFADAKNQKEYEDALQILRAADLILK